MTLRLDVSPIEAGTATMNDYSTLAVRAVTRATKSEDDFPRWLTHVLAEAASQLRGEEAPAEDGLVAPLARLTRDLTAHLAGRGPLTDARARLTEAEVLHIRQRYAGGRVTHRGLAAEYGVSESAIGHLLRGTSWTSLTDGTAAPGRARRVFKLTEAQVRQIRERYSAGGIRHKDLAAEYGVARSTISHLLSGRNWQWLDGGASAEVRPLPSAARLTREEVRHIRERYAVGGVRQACLAAEHGVSCSAISQIISGRTWKEL